MPRIRTIAAATLGVLAVSVLYLSRGPELDLGFERELETTLSPGEVDQAMRDLRQWPRWFHSLAAAQLASGASTTLEPTSTVSSQAPRDLILKIDPHKGPRKKFTLQARLLEYVPGRRLSLRITHDSKDRLTTLFDRLEWTVEVMPAQPGGMAGQTMLRGGAVAHTSHWRTRLFGRIADRVLMNQVYYPDLFRLARLNDAPDETLPPID